MTYFVTLKILSSRSARSTLIPKEVPGLMAAQTTSKMLPTMTCNGDGVSLGRVRGCFSPSASAPPNPSAAQATEGNMRPRPHTEPLQPPGAADGVRPSPTQIHQEDTEHERVGPAALLADLKASSSDASPVLPHSPVTPLGPANRLDSFDC